MRYGVYKPDATLMACSVDEVERRILARGDHTAPFSKNADPAEMARAILADLGEMDIYFGMSEFEFNETITSRNIVWTPDGDEAFDDGSRILHFDVGSQVRLIAFRSQNEEPLYVLDSLRDIWIDSDVFYGVLSEWNELFKKEWTSAMANKRGILGADS